MLIGPLRGPAASNAVFLAALSRRREFGLPLVAWLQDNPVEDG
jgi:hypothetical protein